MAQFSIYTQPVVDEAKRRGIHVSPIAEMSSDYAVLEYRGHREYLCQGMSDRAGSVAFRILYHKAASLRLIGELGVPVAATLFTNEAKKALTFAKKYHQVAIKPVDKSFGQGVSLQLRHADEIKAAMAKAAKITRDQQKRVLVQEFCPGEDNRVLVVGQKRVFGIQRVPAFVVGDGQRTVDELIDDWNAGIRVANRRLRVDDHLVKYLAKVGYKLDTLVTEGAVVRLCELANAHRGGFATDITELMCDDVVEMALTVARHFDCDFLGVDFISEDIAFEPGKVIEVNPHAGMTLHHQPTFGKARNVAGAVVDCLFPETQS